MTSNFLNAYFTTLETGLELSFFHFQDSDRSDENAEDPDIAKIKKVQSFFRGWLCRRRWKQIVDEYIRSPHAESMRKRNW